MATATTPGGDRPPCSPNNETTSYKIMPEEIDKTYVSRQIAIAKATDNPDIKNNCLYRAGTQMEVIPCDGNDSLTPEQQQTVLTAASKLLEGHHE